MTSWNAEASNYLHKLATCIVAVISASNERQDYARMSDRTPASYNSPEGRDQKIQVASTARPRVFGKQGRILDTPKQKQDLHNSRSNPFNLLGGRDRKVHVGSSAGSRVFCTGGRHWICRLKARNKHGRKRESVDMPKHRQYILSTKSKLGKSLDMSRL